MDVMSWIVGLHELLLGHEWLFAIAVGFACIAPPFGPVTVLVINRSRDGFTKTMPLVGVAVAGNALTCLLLACALAPVMRFLQMHGLAIKITLGAVVSVVLIFLLVRKFLNKKPLLNTKDELPLGFLGALISPINYIAFGSAQLLLASSTAEVRPVLPLFYSFVLLGCAAGWLLTASYIPLYRLGQKSLKAVRRKQEEASVLS